ncbi:MAG: hypothetical protein JSS00_07630 [Proteobacteria bacterium]|nr:hypothetical protein [Pseudomonadota bacterium]
MSRKYWLLGVLAILALLVGGGAYAAREPYAYARVATAYAAKQMCSCLHVSGRTADSCMAEFPQAARGQFSVTSTGNRVHASVMFDAVSADAVYEEEYGCRLLN